LHFFSKNGLKSLALFYRKSKLLNSESDKRNAKGKTMNATMKRTEAGPRIEVNGELSRVTTYDPMRGIATDSEGRKWLVPLSTPEEKEIGVTVTLI
jgi:hypothetical protein